MALEAEGLPDVVASVGEGFRVELHRHGTVAWLAAQHAIEQRSTALAHSQSLRHPISPRLTDAALQIEVSGGMTERRSSDVHYLLRGLRSACGLAS